MRSHRISPGPSAHAAARRSQWDRFADGWIPLGLLLLAGLHLGWRVEPSLRYAVSAPPFFTDASFFERFSRVPGGMLEYLAAGLAQPNIHNWLGAAVTTAVLGAVYVVARRLLTDGVHAGATVGSCALVALLAALPGRYESGFETTALGVLVALLARSLQEAVPLRQAGWRVALSWAIASGLFYTAGTLPAALFISVTAAQEWRRRAEPWVALACATAWLVVPLWRWLHPAFVPFGIVRHWEGVLTQILHALVFLALPSCIVAQSLAARLLRHASPPRTPRMLWALGLLCLPLFWGGCLDSPRRTLARLDQAVQGQQWDQALAAARELRTWPASARVQVARALGHAGRLPEDLFAFPQKQGLPLLPGNETGMAMARAKAEALFELGQVNLAEHLAHESLELEGPRPQTLLLIAHINILKDRPEAARIFLNRLRLAPFQQPIADQELRRLAADPRGEHHPQLGLLRSLMPATDEPDADASLDLMLAQSLKANPTNQVALAFLLAHRLLSTQIDELAEDLARNAKAIPAPLPRPCEEALLLRQARTANAAPTTSDASIRPSTVARYQRFADVLRQHGGQPAAARASLAREFGDTFWFYALFGETTPTSLAASPPRRP